MARRRRKWQQEGRPADPETYGRGDKGLPFIDLHGDRWCCICQVNPTAGRSPYCADHRLEQRRNAQKRNVRPRQTRPSSRTTARAIEAINEGTDNIVMVNGGVFISTRYLDSIKRVWGTVANGVLGNPDLKNARIETMSTKAKRDLLTLFRQASDVAYVLKPLLDANPPTPTRPRQ